MGCYIYFLGVQLFIALFVLFWVMSFHRESEIDIRYAIGLQRL